MVLHVGPAMLLGWFAHFGALVAYTLAHWLLAPLKPLLPRDWYRARRLLDALRWGSGSDWHYARPGPPPRPS